MYAVAYVPVRIELNMLGEGTSLLVLGVCITVTVALLDVIGRHAARRLTEPPEDPNEDLSSTTVLDISGALQSHAGR
jgi:demethoxyubiquinone hydroxylase (CLK1/Coq7/Cat5 family)